jgi:hypothetical protein
VSLDELVRDVLLRDACMVPEEVLAQNPHAYRAWKATTGNAKSRRRWMRRDVPNRRKEEKSDG